MNFTTRQNKVQKALAILLWIGVWQVLAMAIAEKIIIVSPVEVLEEILRSLGDKVFWINIVYSTSKVIGGFISGTIIGVLFAILANRYNLMRILLEPLFQSIKTVPVVSFIIILLFFIKNFYLPIIISTLIVLPITYFNVLNALLTIDKKFLTIARLYNFSYAKKIKYIFIPAVKKSLWGTFKSTAGLAWKSSLAAEVIAMPKYGMGKEILQGKLYLETEKVFAYTFVAIILSLLMEKILLSFGGKYEDRN